MDLADALAAARATHQSVLTTLRRDGKPQLSNVLHTCVTTTCVIVSTTDGPGEVPQPATRALGGAQGGRESVLVVRRDRGRGGALRGGRRARTTQTVEELVEYYRSISGEHPDWDDYRRAMVAEQRVVARLTPTRAYGCFGLADQSPRTSPSDRREAATHPRR